MEFNIGRVVLLRTLEFVKIAVIPSMICTILNLSGILWTDLLLGFGLFFGAAIFIIFDMIYGKRCYISLDRDANLYLRGSVPAYLIFVAVSTGVLAFVPEEISRWFFSTLIVWRYCVGYNMFAPLAALVFHSVGFAIAALVPAYMKYGRGFLRIERRKRR